MFSWNQLQKKRKAQINLLETMFYKIKTCAAAIQANQKQQPNHDCHPGCSKRD